MPSVRFGSSLFLYHVMFGLGLPKLGHRKRNMLPAGFTTTFGISTLLLKDGARAGAVLLCSPAVSFSSFSLSRSASTFSLSMCNDRVSGRSGTVYFIKFRTRE